MNGRRCPTCGQLRNTSREFDYQWRYGKPAEDLVIELCGSADKGNVYFEVKRKRQHDGKFYIETEDDPGRRGEFQPSGLEVTTADVYAIAIADSGIVVMVRTELLRTAIERNYGRPASEYDGGCPTNGRLLDVWDLLAAAKPGRASRAEFGDFTVSLFDDHNLHLTDCGDGHPPCEFTAGSLYCVNDPCGNPHHRLRPERSR